MNFGLLDLQKNISPIDFFLEISTTLLTVYIITWHKKNKAIVDYTSPVLCTRNTTFPLIGDVSYCQRAGGGLSHGRRQHAQKIW